MKALARWRRPLGALLFAFALSGVGCQGRPRKEKAGHPKLTGSGHVAVVNLRAAVPEGSTGGGLFPTPTRQTYVSLVRELQQLGSEEDVQAVFVKLAPRVGYARAEELAEVLRGLSQKSRPVVCHAHELDNSTLWLARRGCDQIWVSAAGDVPTVGIGAELTYLKGALDKLGVEADMLAIGRYKSGAESLTRDGPSDEARENLQQTLAALRAEWLEGLSRGATDPEALRRSAEDGPYTPERAKALGLVTHVGFEDQALDAAREAGGVGETKSAFGPDAAGKDQSLAELVRLLAGGTERTGGQRRIAVVPAVGAITMAPGGMFSEDGITAAALGRTLRRLREDQSVRAVVLRLDSPGGSPLASDLIWRELMLLREEKPVVASIGSMAASGGYYIASGATKIVAARSAIVGSIGVFGGKLMIGGALERFGVHSVQVAASPAPGAATRATHLSPLSRWDEPTRERVRESMQRIYDLFIARVAEGRAMPAEQVRANAEGAIFLATSGKERGLVDELGGVARALELARQLGGLPSDVRVTVEGGVESVLEALLLGPEPEAGEVEAALARFQRARAAEAAALAPGAEELLRPFAAAVAPLLAGESVVAALPYSLTLR